MGDPHSCPRLVTGGVGVVVKGIEAQGWWPQRQVPSSSQRHFSEGAAGILQASICPGPTWPRKRPGMTQARLLPPPFPLVPQDRGLIQKLGTHHPLWPKPPPLSGLS